MDLRPAVPCPSSGPSPSPAGDVTCVNSDNLSALCVYCQPAVGKVEYKTNIPSKNTS